VCSPAIDYIEAVRLSDGTSIYTAELYAIGMAVGRIADAPLDSRPFVIFTDSLGIVELRARFGL